MLASSIFSLRLAGDKRVPKYMQQFYWYTIVAALFSFYNFFQKYFNISSQNAFGFFHSTLLLFHFIFLSYFIYCALPKKIIPKVIKLLFFFFFLMILTCLLTNDLNKPQSAAFTICNLGLVIFCCFYFSQLFEEMPTMNLLNEPSFWTIIGIFFCMCATIPLGAIRTSIFDNKPYELYFLVGTLGYFSYGVMHLFFIKAYLCSINPPKT